MHGKERFFDSLGNAKAELPTLKEGMLSLIHVLTSPEGEEYAFNADAWRLFTTNKQKVSLLSQFYLPFSKNFIDFSRLFIVARSYLLCLRI
jgi:hypothetical protein